MAVNPRALDRITTSRGLTADSRHPVRALHPMSRLHPRPEVDCQAAAPPCVYDTTLRRITAVAAQGRQQYRSFPVIQLMLWVLVLVRTAWRMPLYRWAQRSRRVPRMRQLDLFDGCAE
jgi:hypothetical protein